MKPHCVQFTSYLIREGHISPAGVVSPELMEAAREGSARPVKARGKKLGDSSLIALRDLLEYPRVQARFDGRVLRSLLGRALVEVYESSDIEEVRRAAGVRVHFDGPVRLVRLTDSGKTLISAS